MGHPAIADGVSETVSQLLQQMFESGDSQEMAVADCLNTIAENGDGMESDTHLLCCAEAIRDAANAFIETLKPVAQPENDTVTPEQVWDMLLLVDVHCPMEELLTWSQEWLELAAEWAYSLHLKAGDNDEVEVPVCPFFVPPDETSKGLAYPNGKPFRPTKPEDGNTWAAVVQGKTVAYVILPTCFKTADAMRFLYAENKDKLKGVEWHT